MFPSNYFDNSINSSILDFAVSNAEIQKASSVKSIPNTLAYGDGLDPNCLHPYMWVCKSHYNSSDLIYYNWPYAFGGLFARGLIVKYQEMGKEEFVPKYKEMLYTTTIASVEDTASVLGIDLTDEAFWISALETAKSRIEEFIELSK